MCWKSTYTEVGVNKVNKSSALKTIINFTFSSANTQKGELSPT